MRWCWPCSESRLILGNPDYCLQKALSPQAYLEGSRVLPRGSSCGVPGPALAGPSW